MDSIRPPAVRQNSNAFLVGEGRQWFAVYTKPRHEKRVSQHFKVRGIDAFLPVYRVFHRWNNGCKVLVELPLFPSYVFVRADRQEWARVVAVPGVLSIVGFGRGPSPLPDAEIEALRSSVDVCNFEPHPHVLVGERVRIRSGTMAGIEGWLVREKGDLRVVFTLDLIMQSVALIVDACDLESCPAPQSGCASDSVAGPA